MSDTTPERRNCRSMDMIHTHDKIIEIVLDHVKSAVISVDESGGIMTVNKAACTILDYREDELLALNLGEALNLPQISRFGIRFLIDHLQDGHTTEFTFTPQSRLTMIARLSVTEADLEGKKIYVVVFDDVTPLREAANTIRSLASFPDESPMPIMRYAANGDCLYANAPAKALIRQIESDHMKTDWMNLVASVQQSMQQTEANWVVEGQVFKCLFVPVCEEYVNVYLRNVTQEVALLDEMEQCVRARTRELRETNEYLKKEIMVRMETEKKLRHLSFKDPLTGLANRRLFMERLEHALRLAQRNDTRMAVVFMDLDRFKLVNDTLGHDVGDELLIQVAERLTHCLRKSDTLARLGGDEFAAIFEQISSTEDMERVAEKIRTALITPFLLGQEKVTIGCSIGISFFPEHGASMNNLLKAADLAMYKAKMQRNSWCIYEQTLSDRSILAQELSYALERNELRLMFRPIVDVEKWSINGLEALSYWQNATLGLVAPEDFMAIAESSGQIAMIDRWKIAAGCRCLQQWREQGYQPLMLTLDLSFNVLLQNNLAEHVASILQTSGIPPQQLEFSFSEFAAMKASEKADQALQQLVDLGVKISINNFGAGYSSLNLLRSLPIQRLRIDRTFIRDLNIDDDDQVIVKMIVHLAQLLNIDIVADGVENAQHLAFLRQLGCRYMQGRYFVPLLDEQDVTDLLQQGLPQPDATAVNKDFGSNE